MSTDTDGATPSVRSSDDEMDEDASPPRPRRPSPGAAGPTGAGHSAGADGEAGDPSWVQQEIQRRIAARGPRDSGRHSRAARDPAPGTPVPDAPAPGSADTAPDRTASPDPSTGAAAPAASPVVADPTVPAAAPGPTPNGPASTGAPTDRPGPRPRSRRVPDPYAPDGMREDPARGRAVEPPFRMAGPAADTGTLPSRDVDAPADDLSAAAPKQWPPADGAAGLPRRVPGAGWTLDRGALLGEVEEGAPGDPETRPVPTTWTPAVRSSVAPEAPRDVDDRDDDEYDDEDDLVDPDDDGPLGLTGDTEVIWRAPGLEPDPTPVPASANGEPGLAPYTGARPRRFAVAPTAAAATPEETLETAETAEQPAVDAPPQGKRVRIVLSERRAVAHTVRTVVDVQDPGTVGHVWRTSLVTNQLALALRVGGVALLGLGLLPALFAAFPAIGEVSVLGIRLPWLVLGFLVYPFLMLLGWWFTGSAERVEQNFVQDVQDR